MEAVLNEDMDYAKCNRKVHVHVGKQYNSITKKYNI